MIIVRAPLRISFVGGGTDLAAFYKKSPGRVLSAAIDKYVYVTITRTPGKSISVRYSTAEYVDHPKKLEHHRVREALLDLNILDSIEISSFSQLPGQTGLGSSSAFSVALIKGLNALLGKKLGAAVCAEEASRLEIDLVGDPIGKQDQYASAHGGLNILQFNQDESVDVEPILLDYQHKLELEDHLLLFFTGITRSATSVLTEQRKKTKSGVNVETLKKMAGSVHDFAENLRAREYEKMGAMLHAGWQHKKTLASNVSNPGIDALYDTARRKGAWGGKLLGAGGGGCLLFFVAPQKRAAVEGALERFARAQNLEDAAVIPFSFVQNGVEIIHEQ
ncbi:MAG TPA: GHMP kinase [Candidatus Paceibacterota bacterium]